MLSVRSAALSTELGEGPFLAAADAEASSRRPPRAYGAFAAVLRTLPQGEPGSLLSHYAADDFGLLVAPEGAGELVARALHGLETTIREFYDAADLSAGGLVGRDRFHGQVAVQAAGEKAGGIDGQAQLRGHLGQLVLQAVMPY